MNVMSNGIDAYDTDSRSARSVLVSVIRSKEGIEMKVTDFGRGIPASKQEKVFEPFYSTKKGGTGIGLAIAKRMVEKDFSGTIKVASSKKIGTTFTILLPNATKNDH
jgi:signal transduction histidine kinase